MQPSSLCGVPLTYPLTGETFGVLLLSNKLNSGNQRANFHMDDVYLIQSIGSLLTGQLKIATQENGNRYKELQKWCKMVFSVTNTTESKQILAKTILQQIYADPLPEVLLGCSLQLLKSLINTERARFAYKGASNWVVLSASPGLLTDVASPEEEQLFNAVQESPEFFKFSHHC